MLVIRLFRVGKKNQPSFKIVITDKRKPPRAGRFVEEVGFYNPLTKEKVLKAERIKYWLSVGVKPSATVYNLLIKEKIIEGKKIPKHRKPPSGQVKETTILPPPPPVPAVEKLEEVPKEEKEKPKEKPKVKEEKTKETIPEGGVDKNFRKSIIGK